MGTHELSPRFRALIAIVLLAATAVRADEPPASEPGPKPPPEASPQPPPNGPPPDVPAEVPIAAKESNYSFVPIPEIILDPNEGDTYGLMGVVLFKNEQDEITYMLAPNVRYNQTK